MLDLLHGRGVVAIVGRRGGQRLWDLAERWYPETEKISLREAERRVAEKRFRALGVRLTAAGWEAHPDVSRRPGSRSRDAPVPLRPPDPRPRPRGGVVRLPLPARDVRPEGEARVRLLRPPDPRGRSPRRPRRAALRPKERDTPACSARGATPPASTKRSTASRPSSPPNAPSDTVTRALEAPE